MFRRWLQHLPQHAPVECDLAVCQSNSRQFPFPASGQVSVPFTESMEVTVRDFWGKIVNVTQFPSHDWNTYAQSLKPSCKKPNYPPWQPYCEEAKPHGKATYEGSSQQCQSSTHRSPDARRVWVNLQRIPAPGLWVFPVDTPVLWTTDNLLHCVLSELPTHRLPAHNEIAVLNL